MRLAAVGATICAALALVPAAAADRGSKLRPIAKVAPGVFLAKAPKTGKQTARSARRTRELMGSTEARGAQPRIVGGDATTIAEWPWQAAITLNPNIFAGNAFQRQFCGGTLVTPSIVVTAGHCVFDFDNGEFFPVSDHASVTGRTTLSNNGQGQEILWSNYFVFVDGAGNPLFNPNTLEWDAVFAQLASPSPGSNSTPISIAGSSQSASWTPGPTTENAWATGWGCTMQGCAGANGSQDTLREVNIDMITDAFCLGGTSYGSDDFFPETMVCAGETGGGEDTCQGDSGGPLVVDIAGPDFTDGPFRLVGDTSFGFGCAAANFPGVYGRLAEHPLCTALQNGIQSVAGTNIVDDNGTCLNAGTPAGFVPVGDLNGGPPPPPPGGDTAPPDTTITKGPKNKTKKKQATFTFEANEPATFNCTLDGKQQFKACTSPTTVKVKKGKHTFQVQATDQAGNTDPTPASDSWKVKRKRKK